MTEIYSLSHIIEGRASDLKTHMLQKVPSPSIQVLRSEHQLIFGTNSFKKDKKRNSLSYLKLKTIMKPKIAPFPQETS